jgi:hypothetical protein
MFNRKHQVLLFVLQKLILATPYPNPYSDRLQFLLRLKICISNFLYWVSWVQQLVRKPRLKAGQALTATRGIHLSALRTLMAFLASMASVAIPLGDGTDRKTDGSIN